MVLFTHHVKKIKVAAHKNGMKNATRKHTFTLSEFVAVTSINSYDEQLVRNTNDYDGNSFCRQVSKPSRSSLQRGVQIGVQGVLAIVKIGK